MVNIGVVGAGYLGRFHVEKFQTIENCKLVGIAEVSEEVRQYLKKNFDIPVYDDYRELAGKVDAVSIVVPTPLHFEVAQFFIQNNIHTFIEKPVTETVEQCERLKAVVASRPDLKVQIGHIERFNPVYKVLKEKVKNPFSVTIRRKSPFTSRGTEVDIVFDLMIHDIDIILSLFPDRDVHIKSCNATRVVSETNDYFKVDFSLGTVDVTLEASRVHNKKERSVTVVCEDVVYEGDFVNQELYFKTPEGDHNLQLGKKDILMEELKSFVNSVQYKNPVTVSLEDGYRALLKAYDFLYHIGKSK